jgi:hypothetical protein
MQFRLRSIWRRINYTDPSYITAAPLLFVYLTPTPLYFVYLTPTPLLKERGYIPDYVCITLLLLKEKEMEDEVKLK